MSSKEKHEFTNYYKCPKCSTMWESDWDSACDDECECGERDISPYRSCANNLDNGQPTKTLYQRLVDIQAPIDHHESDLYAKATPEVQELLIREFPGQPKTSFLSQIDKTLWFEFAFLYDPFWERREQPHLAP